MPLVLAGCTFPAAFVYDGQDKATLVGGTEQTWPVRIVEVNGAVFSHHRIAAPDLVTVAPGRVVVKLVTWRMPGPTFGHLCALVDVSPGDRVEFVSESGRNAFQVTMYRVWEGKRMLVGTELVPYRGQEKSEPCDPRLQNNK